MRVTITGDTASVSGIGEVIDCVCGPTRRHFASKDYGPGVLGLGIILMCQNPTLNLKRRTRFSKKDKMFYMDIMLDLPAMQAATPAERRQEVAQRLYDEVPDILVKHKIENFDKENFVIDLRTWIDKLGWR